MKLYPKKNKSYRRQNAVVNIHNNIHCIFVQWNAISFDKIESVKISNEPWSISGRGGSVEVMLVGGDIGKLHPAHPYPTHTLYLSWHTQYLFWNSLYLSWNSLYLSWNFHNLSWNFLYLAWHTPSPHTPYIYFGTPYDCTVLRMLSSDLSSLLYPLIPLHCIGINVTYT